MTAYFKQSKDIGQQIHNLIFQLIKLMQQMTLEKYIELSTIKGHNKKYLKSLLNQYLDKYPLDLNMDIYNSDKLLKFMAEKCNFDRTSAKKIRNIFLLSMRK